MMSPKYNLTSDMTYKSKNATLTLQENLIYAEHLMDRGLLDAAEEVLNNIIDLAISMKVDLPQLHDSLNRLHDLRYSQEVGDTYMTNERLLDAAVQTELERRYSRFRRAILAGIALIILSVPAVFLLSDISSSQDNTRSQWAGIISSLIALSTAIAATLVSFLSQRAGFFEPFQRLFEAINQFILRLIDHLKTDRKESPKEDSDLALNQILENLQTQIDVLKNKKTTISDSIEKQIVTELKDQLQRSAAESLLTDLANEQRQRQTTQRLNSIIAGTFSEVRQRLKDELTSLRRSAIANLTGGSFLTLFALLLLSVFVFGDLKLPSDGDAFAIHIVARASLIIALEAFALFFLRLYKQCLIEIKYYHNELTNMEMRALGTILATQDESTDTQQLASTSLLSTERNFVLKKGETTTEIEKHRINIGFDQHVLKEAVSITNKTASALKS